MDAAHALTICCNATRSPSAGCSISSTPSMTEADAQGPTSGAAPQLSDLLLRSLKRTYDMFSTESVTAAIPTFLPSQRLKVAIKLHQEYTLPKGVTQPTDGEGDNGAHVEAGATPSGAKGRSNPTDITNIIKTLETEKEEKMFESALSGAAQGKGGGGALVEYKGPGGALITAQGAAAGASGGGALALRRQPPKVPKPKWHAPWKLQSVIAGHLGWVRSIAFDPSNDWFVTGSADRTIKVWDLAKCTAGAEGGLKLTLTGHISAIRGLSVSPRHPYLFSCGEDKMVKCWDLEQNRVIRSYHGHLSGVYSLALHPTLDILITGGRDSVARVWDIRTKHQVHVLGGHTNVVGAVATNSVDPQVITGSHDATIKLWDLAAGKSLMTLTHHKKSVRDLKIHPKEQSFVSGSPDNIKKWQVRDGKFLKNLSGHNTVINALAVNVDDVLVSCGDNGSMYLWDYQTGYNFQRLQTIVQPGSLDAEAGIFACCFDLSGTKFLTGEADKSIKIYHEDLEATKDSYPIDMRAWTEECLRPKRY